MKQEDKQLLLVNLCGRLPYEVKVQYNNEIYNIDYISALYEEVKLDIPDNYTIGISEIKPYLRPMSSMTEEEYEQYRKFSYYGAASYRNNDYKEMVATPSFEKMDFLNAHHFDYRGLIEKGLAIEVTEENNPYEN